MAVRRKVFRIEESVRPHALRNGATSEVDGVVNRSELLAELAALRALIASPSSPDSGVAGTRAQIDQARAYRQELSSIFAAVEAARGDMEALKADARSGERTARASRELAAIVGGTEKATQDVLQAAEKIDQAAAILAAAVKNPQDLGLTRDIQDYVVQIYEACNFQDLTGQHVGHVVAALKFVEERVARLLEFWHGIEGLAPAAFDAGNGDRQLLNGPKLPGDSGHFAQAEIDLMFRSA